MSKLYIYFVLLCLTTVKLYSQSVTADAGPTKTVCANTSYTIGGSPTASNGTPPYTYNWSPSTFLGSTNVANPLLSNVNSDMWYRVIVSDAKNSIDTAYVFIKFDDIKKYNAGIDSGYCFGQKPGIMIGSSVNASANNTYTFNWLPADGLSNANSANPIATPTITTNYTLTVSDATCPSYSTQVTVAAWMPPPINASADTTIDEGNTITLMGSGANIYWWTPDYNIKYRNTANPDVWPTITTTYYFSTEDQHGCVNYDDVTVTVVKGDKLFFYNTFTPNNDGDNDMFYIGNLGKYPDNSLKIYNRYGKLIYSATNYDNSWNGTYLGNEVPSGTYFYIFDDGKEAKYNGTVTIIR